MSKFKNLYLPLLVSVAMLNIANIQGAAGALQEERLAVLANREVSAPAAPGGAIDVNYSSSTPIYYPASSSLFSSDPVNSPEKSLVLALIAQENKEKAEALHDNNIKRYTDLLKIQILSIIDGVIKTLAPNDGDFLDTTAISNKGMCGRNAFIGSFYEVICMADSPSALPFSVKSASYFNSLSLLNNSVYAICKSALEAHIDTLFPNDGDFLNKSINLTQISSTNKPKNRSRDAFKEFLTASISPITIVSLSHCYRSVN